MGPAGPGPNSLTGQTLIVVGANSATTTATATCPGTHPNLVGGGYRNVDVGGNGQWVKSSYPSATNVWTVELTVADTAWNAYAMCTK